MQYMGNSDGLESPKEVGLEGVLRPSTTSTALRQEKVNLFPKVFVYPVLKDGQQQPSLGVSV